MVSTINAQTDVGLIQSQLEEQAKETKGLNETVEFDVSGLNLYELITTIADEHNLNVSVDIKLNDQVASNFYDVKVKDAFVFLIQEYNIEFEIFSNILIFKRKLVKAKKIEVKPLKIINITYNQQNDFLSINLKNDSLPRVAEKITDLSNKNIVLAPDLRNVKVSAYIKNRPFNQVLEMMAQSNGLTITAKEGGFYYLEKNTIVEDKSIRPANNRSSLSANQRSIRNNQNNNQGNFDITVNPNGYLKIKASNADIGQIIMAAAEKVNANYFLYDMPEGLTTTLFVNGIRFDDLLNHLFKGTMYTYQYIDDFYIIGDDKKEGLRATELIQLENRTIESVKDAIPQTLLAELEVVEFIELNGLVVSGPRPSIEELKNFIFQIDKVVPLVQIEVLIVQYQKSYDIQTGIQAGIGENPSTTSGALLPAVDISLSTSSINGLINAFNGLGIINIGKVSSNFYLNLKALENNSVINIQSTPKIATLSGHEATVSIGETSYYFELSNRLINSGIGNDVLQSGQWKSTEANLSVNIKPFVSTDGHVTLDITVEKSSFLGRAGENAPPGKSTQKFDALIRVKDGEMILLGGLDELTREDSGTGTPFLSRIPIIKWFFSSRSKRKDKSKLHVFIKPMIIY